MMHRSNGATALLGMPGFVVGAQLEVDGEWWLHVETTADDVGCEACGTRAVGHGASSGEGARPARRRPAARAGMGEAAVALSTASHPGLR